MAIHHILLETYEFTDEKELRAAQILNPSNLQFIKSQLAIEKQRKENLVPDPNNYAEFIQQEAHIKGAISAYQFLIDSHNSIIRALSDEVAAQN